MTSYPTPSRVDFPLQPYDTGDFYVFGTKVGGWLHRATHLGDDLVAAVDTPVTTIGEGTVVWAEMRLGTVTKRNWGGVVVVGHTHKKNQTPFFSVYGHLYHLAVSVGTVVDVGQTLGMIAPGASPENGWWRHPHLHFGIYTGPWQNRILPGYKRWREFGRTRRSWWHDPRSFITAYNHT